MTEFDWQLTPSATPTPAGSGTNLATTQPIRRDFKLDDHGNRVIAGNTFVFVYDAEAIAQAVRIRLRFFYREWPFDLSKGTRLFDILGKKNGLALARSIIRERILGTLGVASLTSLTLSLDAATRVLTVVWAGTTDVGALAPQTVQIDSP